MPYLQEGIGGANEFPPLRGGCTWDEFIAPFAGGPIDFEPLPFDHPLYILYSSGTTGVPKCIVHGAGGTLLQHLKEHRLHGDVKPGDRLFYFTTCGWMMWNWLASGLAAGATLLLYDGSPFVARGRVLWDFADAERMTHFGTSAKYIDALRKVALVPVKDYALKALRTMLSTGSPLAPESFDYVYEAIKHDVCLSSISGGTDIVSCFVLGNPTLPVWRGEIQCRGLGMAVDAFDDDGNPVRQGERGELVCTKPFPSMPIGFWNDPDGAKYRAAYFERFPGVWWHGDFIEITAARRHRHLRPLRCDAESRRRAHRHRRDLPAGRAAARGASRRSSSARTGPRRGRRRARRAVREAARWHDARRRADRPDPEARPREHDAASRAGEDRAGRRHPAHEERQDRRARGAQRRARPGGQEPRGAGESRSARAVPRPGRAEDVKGAGIRAPDDGAPR